MGKNWHVVYAKAGRGVLGLAAGVFASAILVFPATAEACGGWFAGVLVPRCPAPESAPDPGGSEAPDQPVPVAGKQFGFNSALYMSGQSTLDQELGHAETAGATVHRLGISWKALQRSPTAPPLPEAHAGSSVERLDQFYAAALARDITPIFIPYEAPLWATRYGHCNVLDLGCQSIATSTHKLVPEPWSFDEYQAFVTAVKRRWPGALIEAWNEPNLYWAHPAYQGSRAFAASPQHFAAVQCAAYTGSKAVSDDPVLAAGWADHRLGDYLDGVLAAGGGDCWDIANFHPYPSLQTSFDRDTRVAQLFQTFRSTRARHGDADPIWITETGYTTTGGQTRAVSADVQADASRRLYNRLITMPDVEAVLFHTLRDAPLPGQPYSDPGQGEYGYGFLYGDWRPKPVYCYFAAQAGNSAC